MGKRGSMSLPGWESSRGEQGRGHKLTEPQAREILALAGKGIAAHQLAKKYGVSTESVRGIWRRLTWKHLKHRCDQCGSENEPELDRTIATRLCKE